MRISEAFREKPLLIVYICAGDPSPAATPDLVRRLARAGADIIITYFAPQMAKLLNK